MRSAHEALGWFVIVANGLVGAWALAAHWRPALRVPALWPATAVAEVAVFVQVILGVAYQRSSGIDPGQLHVLYGFAGLFAVALLYGYRAQIEERKYMLYGCGGLFLMGLGIRALFLHA